MPSSPVPTRPRWAVAWLALALWSPGCGSNGPDESLGGDGSIPSPSTPAPGPAPATPAPAPKAATIANPVVPQEVSPFRFTDVVKPAGIDFVQVSGMTAERHFPSANGSGAAVFDYDGDGRMDLYFATATLLPLGSAKNGPNRLYKNLGDGTFSDVTESSGLGFAGFCHGVVVGDLDNDGDQDVVLCNYGPDKLFLNNGDGTFRDVGRASGIEFDPAEGTIVAGDSGTGDGPIVVDAVSAGGWKVNGQETDRPTLKVRQGQRIVFRQADPGAAHGVKFLYPENVAAIKDGTKPKAVLGEVGAEASRIGRRVPPIAPGAGPVVIAEFEVVREPKEPVGFLCAAHEFTWSSGGACLDVDDDGDLDLYLSNYGQWYLPRDDEYCGDREKNVRQYCNPKTVRTVKHFLWRNDGLKDGVPRFTDIYDEFLVDDKGGRLPGRGDGHGFGVVAADVNGDGKIDLYVANDQNPNFLFLNQGGGKFRDATDASGAAYDDSGKAQSGMGVDAQDVDGDGKPELFVTNFKDEYNTLYNNLGDGNFYDLTANYGLVADSLPWVGWGCTLSDFDNDGWPDCFVTNGHVDDNYHKLGQDVPYEEPPLLYANVPQGRGPEASRKFRIATRGVGAYFDTGHVGRGVAFGDLNDDGRLDIVVNHKDKPPAVLRNDTPPGKNHWIRLKLQGTRSNRDAIGARIEVVAGGRTIHRQRKGGTSLESSHDPRVLIGVGAVESIEKLVVRWPSGGPDSVLDDLKVDQTYDVVEPKAGP